MKSWIFAAGLLVTCAAAAQVGPSTLTYRDSDPFLFCHEGQDIKKNPDRCWWPVAPYTGGAAWVNSPNCEPVDPYGEPWDADDYASMKQYQLVCPVAKTSGEWQGAKGAESMTPNAH